jgi:hypothetical protein
VPERPRRPVPGKHLELQRFSEPDFSYQISFTY